MRQPSTAERNTWRAAAYEEGHRVGRIHMQGGMHTTRNVEPGGASLRQAAARTAGDVGLATPDLIERVVALHDERVAALPDLAVYPELEVERDLVAERYRGMAEAGMSRELIALGESLKFWCDYRCRAELGRTPHGGNASPAQRERCRVVYAPRTDVGTIHFKNVDDPLNTWVPLPEKMAPIPDPFMPLFFDGVGNGLHIDDPPPEIFPADGVAMAKRYCTTVEEAEEFLIRYNYFWGSANILVHDKAGNAVAIDKASRCRYAVRRPGANGVLYINGMSSFDADYEAFIEGRRQQYLEESGQDATTAEATYFDFAEGTLRNMKRRMAEYEQEPTEEALFEHMCSRDADGPLCRTGVQHHPDDPTRAATLFQRCYYPERRIMKWRQWHGDTPVWEDSWKTVSWQ